MAEDIEKIIFGLELDGSAYIRGADSLIDSTKKLTVEQERANKALAASQAILKSQSTYYLQTKKDLDSYTGTNEKYRLQLEKTFNSADLENKKLSEEVLKNQKAYEAATKAAQDFANVSARASNLQAQTTGGKIPTGPPPAISANITNQIAGVLNVADFAKQAQIVEQTKNEFDDLRVSIALADERMKQLNETDAEFQDLAPIVQKGKEALEQYDQATQGATKSQVSIRTQLRQGREELVKLEQAGKGATKQYFELEKQVAKLTDEFADQQARIKILASDTKLLDFGKGAITAATSAFQAYTAISILAGDESEELQKKTMQLFAAMQLLQSLEQLSNLTRREGVLATLAQSGAQTVYTAVVGASTGALRAFRLALLATGIGAAVVLIGFLVSKWLEYREAVKKAGEQQKLLNDVVAEGNKESGKQIADLKILTQAVKDANLPMKERLDAVKQLQKEFPDYFGNLSKEAILTGDITEATKQATAAIIAAGRARAAKGKIDALESEQLDLDFEKERVLNKAREDFAEVRRRGNVTQDLGLGVTRVATEKEQKQIIAFNVKAKLDDIQNKKETLARQEDFLTKFVGLGNITKTVVTPDKEPPGKKITEIQNVYLAEKEKLDIRLAELNRKEADNASKIRVEFQARLIKEQSDIDKLLREKKLTEPQAADLKVQAGQINTVELDKALKDFSKKTIDARQKINDELEALQDKNTEQQINLIQNEFERRSRIIKFNEEKEIVDTITANQKRLETFETSSKQIFGEDFENNQTFINQKKILVAEGEQLITNITLDAANKRKDLAADIFQGILDSYDAAIKNANLVRDEDTAKQVQALNSRFLAGKISFQKYQDEIKKIKDAHDRDEEAQTLNTDKNKLAALDRQLAAEKDKYSKHYKDLKKQRDELAGSIATREAEPLPDTDPNKDRVNNVVKYADAIGAIANSIVGFWQEANRAEAEALDRSISLQEKRVAAAQRIADRGNAQYLKAEEDRLTELNVKRENAARKQLGIDAALQASQILVGITGAIAKIATPGIGIAETIGAIAVIIGALATGYGLVKSLQGNQPKLAEGTTELKRGRHPQGRDTIPAWLDEGEAVIPTKTNKKYKKTVEAIYHGKIPADVMNEFVENYVRSNTVRNKKEDTHSSTKYERFVRNISNIPAKELNNFINNYEKKEVKKYFTGTTDVKTTGQETIPAWFSEGKPVKAKNFTETKEAIFKGKIPASVINEFAEKYVKDVKNKKDTKELTSIIKKVLSENNIKNVSDTQIDSFINNYKNEKVSSLTQTIFELVNKKIASEVLDSTSKSLTKDSQYSEVLDKVFKENKQLVESKKVVDLVSKAVSQITDENVSVTQVKNFIQDKKVSDSFINNYAKDEHETKAFTIAEKLVNLVDHKLNKTENVSVDDVIKYSHITNRVFAENKELVEKKNISSLASKVYSQLYKTHDETHDIKNISYDKITSFIDTYTRNIQDKKASSIIENVFNKVNNKLENSESKDGKYHIVETNDMVYSNVIDKIFTENKKLVDSKNISNIISKVLEETGEKNVSLNQISSIIKDFQDNKTSNIIETISSLVNNKINNVKSDNYENLVKKHVSKTDVENFSNIVNKIINENKGLFEAKNITELVHKTFNEVSDKKVSLKEISSVVKDKKTYELISNVIENKNKYDNFKTNVARVPDKVLNNFINRYEESKYFKGTTELQGKAGIDNIPIWATKGESIIPPGQTNLYKPVIKAVFNGTVPADKLNSFVNSYHTIKSVPIPDYKRIKESAEIKINSDGRMSVLLSEQNNLLKINNDLQVQILKKRGVHVEQHLDKNGVAQMVTEFMQQAEINKHI